MWLPHSDSRQQRHNGHTGHFMDLFDYDESRVRRLDQLTRKMGPGSRLRPLRTDLLAQSGRPGLVALATGIAQSAHKFSNDIRCFSI